VGSGSWESSERVGATSYGCGRDGERAARGKLMAEPFPPCISPRPRGGSSPTLARRPYDRAEHDRNAALLGDRLHTSTFASTLTFEREVSSKVRLHVSRSASRRRKANRIASADTVVCTCPFQTSFCSVLTTRGASE
jgi:hypothetical protein